jgi:hypothetical protein
MNLKDGAFAHVFIRTPFKAVRKPVCDALSADGCRSMPFRYDEAIKTVFPGGRPTCGITA